MTKLYIAGVEGFIGSHLKEYVQETQNWEVVSREDSPDYVVHLAGHSQIDASIADSDLVSRDIDTTIGLLDWAKTQEQLKKFLYFSSDEVFGPKSYTNFLAWQHYNSYSPYAAGKAACEEMCLAWSCTFGVPILITHCQNLFGERQSANKFLPTVVRCGLTGRSVPIYMEGHEEAKRNFLHVRDACSAITLLLKRGDARQKYNIASEFEITSSGFIWMVENILGVKIKTEFQSANDIRPGFFLAHGLNGNRMVEVGWKRKPLEESLTKTVRWMAQEENRHWLGL